MPDMLFLTTAAWGFVLGVVFIPICEGTNYGVLRIWSPAGSFLRTMFLMLLATAVTSIIVGAVVVGTGHLLGLIPLSENKLLFGMSFAVGGVGMRMFTEYRKRRKKSDLGSSSHF